MTKHYLGVAANLKKTLVFKNGVSVIGLLRNCLEYAMNDKNEIGGVYIAVRAAFKAKGSPDLLDRVKNINDFRNHYVAHREDGRDLRDVVLAEKNLRIWVEGLKVMMSAD